MRYLVLCSTLALAGCASSTALDVASDTIQVTTQAAPICGQVGAQKVAAQQAAIETLRRGYDKYVILDGAYQNNVGVVGTTPVYANTYQTGTINSYGNTATYSGTARTQVYGGQPIIAGSHNQSFLIRMFREGDAQGDRAVSARNFLGPDWQKAVKKGAVGTC